MVKKITLAVFKPYNARRDNSFYSGQHPIFRYLEEKCNYDVTYFIDNMNTYFEGIKVRYIEKKKLNTFILRALKKIMGLCYARVPYYGIIDFSEYDVIITEGIHYPFIDYFKDISYKVILNDTISREYFLPPKQIDYLNKYFSNSLAILVNNKIPVLYERNGIKMKKVVINHALEVENIPFTQREKFNGNIMCAGRLVPEKGFEYIIQAMKVLKTQEPEIKLDIYGEGILREKLQKLIQANGLTNNVFLKGFLEYEHLLNKLGNYGLFLSHPLETSYIAEAFAMTNMEAMASGMPVITSNCGGVPYIVKDKAIVVKQKDVSGIVDAIMLIIKNPEIIYEYSLKGRKYVEDRFTPDKIARKWNYSIRSFLRRRERLI